MIPFNVIYFKINIKQNPNFKSGLNTQKKKIIFCYDNTGRQKIYYINFVLT